VTILCYDFQNGIIDEAKDHVFAMKLFKKRMGIIDYKNREL
jgi:hypothetical protein